jgi:transcriptional regulator with XRE-family HTH domain
MAQSLALVDTLKKTLKQHGLTYEHVAAELDLSLGAVKRFFAKQDFSITRLDQICAMMDLEISDLVLAMQTQQTKTTELSAAQEEELVANEKLLLCANLLINGWSVNEILNMYHIEELEMVRYLAHLDRIKIIDLHPGNRVKLKISRDFTWRKRGPIESFYKKHVQNDFLDSDFAGPGEIRIFLTGMISRNANAELMRRIKRLATAFEEIHREDEAKDLSEKLGTSLVLAMRPWDIHLFEQYRKEGTHRSF